MKTRIRRNKEVQIPEEWQGKVTHKQTIRKRMSKQSAQVRRNTVRHTLKDGSWPSMKYIKRKQEGYNDYE